MLAMRRLRTAVLEGIGICVLVFGIFAIDRHLGGDLTRRTTARSASAQISSVASQAENSATSWARFARDESVANAPMVILGVCGGVLVFFMLRS
jgi:hypothetical protein